MCACSRRGFSETLVHYIHAALVNLKLQYSCYKDHLLYTEPSSKLTCLTFLCFIQPSVLLICMTHKKGIVLLSIWHSSWLLVYCVTRELVNVRERYCYLRHFEMCIVVNLGCFSVDHCKHFTPFWWVFVGLLLYMYILLKALFVVGCYCNHPGWLPFMLKYFMYFYAYWCTCTAFSSHLNLWNLYLCVVIF